MPATPSLFGPDHEETPVVLSYGMGIDSTALLLRWLTEPDSRDFDLTDLTVLTAMTGDEFADIEHLVTTHILHRLREARVRFVQVARTGRLEGDGITVLDDSREPAHLHVRGPYRLSDELLAVGTVPQVAHGQRRCTHHFKGFPLTAWTRREFGDSPIRRVIGYNADEQSRADRAEGYSTDDQPFEFPLVSWGWGRERCEAHIREITGETWRKSCCVFCPFTQGKQDVLARYRESPCEAAEALFLEHVSLCINPAMTLYSSRSLPTVGTQEERQPRRVAAAGGAPRCRDVGGLPRPQDRVGEGAGRPAHRAALRGRPAGGGSRGGPAGRECGRGCVPAAGARTRCDLSDGRGDDRGGPGGGRGEESSELRGELATAHRAGPVGGRRRALTRL